MKRDAAAGAPGEDQMRFKSLFVGSCLIAPSLAAAAPATAQPPIVTPPPIARVAPAVPGSNVIQGNIQVCEAARGEHRITMEAGRRYSISADSEAFDTYLRLLRPGSEEPLAENDDSGDSLNSRISFTPPTSGEYVVRVSSFAPGGVGAYNLRVEPAAPLPALVTRPTRTERGQWRIYQGSLSAADPADGERRYDDYELRLAAGESAMVHVTGEGDLDSQLMIYSADDRGGEPIATDDDGGGGVNPFVFFAPAEAGTYVVRVTSFGANETGSYRLRISQ
jgi:hypothetical protein